MDVATHVLAPYVLALLVVEVMRRRDRAKGFLATEVDVAFQRRSRWAHAFGIAAMAPDLDGLFAWLKTAPGLWPLQHRGFTHTLWGAPLMGLLLLFWMGRLGRRWPRILGALAWRRGHGWAGVLGAWSGLVLDLPTSAGVPLLWPFVEGRVAFPVFHWLLIWMFPLSAGLIALHALRKIPRSAFIAAGLVLILVTVAVAGVRIHYAPDTPYDDVIVRARSAHDEWIMMVPLHGPSGLQGYLTTLHGPIGIINETSYFHRPGPGTDPEDEGLHSIRRAMDSDDYRGFQMGAISPIVRQTGDRESSGSGTMFAGSSAENRMWTVRFIDPAAAMDAQNGARWTPAEPHKTWGVLEMEVSRDHVRVVQRGW